MNANQANLNTNPNIMRAGVENTPKLSLEKTQSNTDPSMNPVIDKAPKVEKAVHPQPSGAGATPAPQQQVTQSSGSVWSNQVHSNAQTDRAKVAQGIAQMTAQDDDLIEKEWVDVTEKVIETNKDDPYSQDEDQHVLSKHYLKKRFNLDVK